MIDGTTVFIALMALCGANVALIWQVSTLADRVRDLDEDIFADRIRRLAQKEDGDGDGEED